MNVLLTGANGFVGINVLNKILETTKWNVVCLINKNHNNMSNDIKQIYNLDECTLKIDIIIHIGGNPSSISCIEKPESAFNDNIQTTFKMLEYARINQVKKFILFSSCEVYGNAIETSCENDILKSYNMYGASKVACEHMLSAYSHSYGISGLSIRLLNSYGPYCQKERFPSIILEMFKKYHIPHFKLYTYTKKKWINIEDVATNTIFLIENMKYIYDVFNFVGNDNIYLHELIQILVKNREFTYEYCIKDEIKGYQHEANANGDKLLNLINKINYYKIL
jgi:UDP-glucose 4-epimerase